MSAIMVMSVSCLRIQRHSLYIRLALMILQLVAMRVAVLPSIRPDCLV